MKQTVKNFIIKHNLLHDGATVVIGVSGGPDSLALLQYLWKEEQARKLTLIVAHAEHGLRGESSRTDYTFVEQFCQKRQIIFEGAHLNVRQLKESKSISTQMAAREARYDFFEKVMKKYAADYLALAQHGDDQVETMLMKQVRGTYSYGLAGIPLKRDFATGRIIRPFLGITKQEIEHYCKEEHLQPRIDESNSSETYTRNRFRKYILPFLKNENKHVHHHFQKLSEWLTDDEDYLIEQTKQKLSEIIISKKERKVVVSVKGLQALRKPLQRRAIHLILVYLYGNIPLNISQVHIEQIISLLNQIAPNKMVYLPDGVVGIRQYDQFIFTFGKNEEMPYFEYEFPIPGMIDLEIGKITSNVVETLPNVIGLNHFVFDANNIALPLTVRAKKDGDFIRPFGLEGTKKVSRLFIDQKIERSLRNQWPIVVDAAGELLWVPQLARSQKGRVTETSKRFIVLTFERKE